MRDRHDTGPRDQPDRRLDAHHPAQRRRAHDGTVGLGADRERREPGRHRRRRTRRRPAGRAVQGVRVDAQAADGTPARRRGAGPEVGPLRQVGLAEDDRPGRAQGGDQGSVRRGRYARERQRPGGGRQAAVPARGVTRVAGVRGIDVVLDQHRNAVQRAPDLAAGALGVAFGRTVGRVRVDGQHRPHRGTGPVDLLDPAQQRGDVLSRGGRAGGVPVAEAGGVQVGRVGGRGRRVPDGGRVGRGCGGAG